MEIEEDTLLIRQLVDFSEIILPLESTNRYEIRNKEGDGAYFAFEVGGRRWLSLLVRSVLSGHRPFTLRIVNDDKKDVLTAYRPFRFYFHRLNVFEDGQWIGAVQRKFSLVNKLFEVLDGDGNLLCEIKGPLWKPWTFDIVQNQKVYGIIRKSWRGWAEEFLTDADTFGIQFPDGATSKEKKILLAAVFLIDFIYFEGNEGQNYISNYKI